MVLLCSLTATVVLGILASRRWGSDTVPRFVAPALHRNLALLSVGLLPLHLLTAILDPFAHLGLKDGLVPFASAYRPLWLGLGVLAGELLVVLVATSLVRARLGYGAWRLVHWLAYLAWPMALVHAAGTGDDVRQIWAQLLGAACIAAVLAALAWRMATAPPRLRTAGGVALGTATVAFAVWMGLGPLRPGWAKLAGTPPALMKAASLQPSPGLQSGLHDPLRGQATDRGDQLQISLADQSRPSITVSITAGPSATSLQVMEDGRTLCASSAAVGEGWVQATCQGLQVTVTDLVGRPDGAVRAELSTETTG
jgi:sulfoxide reductase heme-binding subunit YedZ